MDIAVITGKLVLITCVIAVMIAAINLFTEPVIAANEAAAKEAAIMELFPEATAMEPLSAQLGDAFPEDISEVYAVSKAGLLLGYCVDTWGKGFADKITMMVGITTDNTVAGIRVLTIGDTPGIGLAVAEDEYLSTWLGISYPASFADDSADAISGATYSSRGILDGVNNALEFCALIEVTEGDVPPAEAAPETEAATEQEGTDSE